MSDTIKLFQSTRKYYQALGLHPSTSVENSTFNWRSFNIFFILIFIFYATATYFLFETNINKDYVETLQSFYFSSSSFNFLISFMVNFWKMPNIYALMERFEETVQKSELKFCLFLTFEAKVKKKSKRKSK